MTKSRIFLILALSFLGGVFGASFYYPRDIREELILMSAILPTIIFFVFYKNFYSVIFLAAVFFLGGIVLTETKLEVIRNIGGDGQAFSGIVTIVKESQNKGKYQNIVVRPDDWKPNINFPARSKFLIRSFDHKAYAYGEKLEISCDLKIPDNNIGGEGGKPGFDYQMYLAKDRIFYECQKPKLAKLGINEGSSIYAAVLSVKNSFNSKIEKLFPSPEAGLASGILLGGDDLLSEEWQEKFSLTGMTHIVAVSGYNVTIIAEYLLLLGIFLGLWRKQAFWFALAGIALFIFMIGMPSSAVRAGVMGGLLLWAAKNGRLANSQNAILFSASIMLLINPLLLRWDIGFQLSFLATIGIIYFYPFINDHLVKKHKVFGLSELLFLTLSAQVFVLPVILYNFQRLSLISPLANLAILPIVPLAMILSFLAAAAAFIFLPLATVVAWLAFLPLKYETWVIGHLASLSFSSVEQGIRWWGVVVWYIILIGAIIWFKRQSDKKRIIWKEEK